MAPPSIVTVLVLVLVPTLTAPPGAVAQEKATARQIREAVSALPAALREGAGVLGYWNGAVVTLRPSENGLLCLADDPAREEFHVACYHRDLEPFMARGRELRANGITQRAAIDSIREVEIASGALPFPDRARALYSWTAETDELDPDTGTPVNARGLYVVYLPYATEATTGIPTAPSRSRPWLMYPGRPWAHVMISR